MASQVIKNFSEIIEVTPTVDTNAYTTDYRLGSIQTILNAVKIDGEQRGCVLESIVVLDKDAQSIGMEIFFFRELPTVASADNSALDISDTEMRKCIGTVQIPTANFVATASNSIATVKGIGLVLKPAQAASPNLLTDQTKIYAVVKTLGSPTYSAADSLVFKYGLLQD